MLQTSLAGIWEFLNKKVGEDCLFNHPKLESKL
jgi:hypothetical protein